jgi:uncharacterized OsmC-like protein
MKITVLGEHAVRLEDSPEALTIDTGAGHAYGPFHMLAGGLASCTFSVLRSWAAQARIDASALAIEVRWTFAEDPHRVGDMAVSVRWPGLPAGRHAAARRAAGYCTVKTTLEHPPSLSIELAG